MMAVRGLAKSDVLDHTSEIAALAEGEETLVTSVTGDVTSIEVWVRAPSVAWEGVVVRLYGRVGAMRVLLQSRLVGAGVSTLDAEDELHAFVLSQRGPRVSSFEVYLLSPGVSLLGPATITARTWSQPMEAPFIFERPDVAPTADRVVLRDGEGRARFVGLDLHGESIRWDSAQPSATIGWSAADPSGVGGSLSIAAQQGASGSIGGALTIGAGAGGSATDKSGTLVVDLGNEVAGVSAPLVVRTGAGDRFQVIQRAGPNTYFEALAGGFVLKSANGDEIGGSLGVVALQAASGGVYLTSLVNLFFYRGANQATVRSETLHPTGASSISWAKAVTGVHTGQVAEDSGAGAAHTYEAQHTTAAAAGGSLNLLAGEGAPGGTAVLSGGRGQSTNKDGGDVHLRPGDTGGGTGKIGNVGVGLTQPSSYQSMQGGVSLAAATAAPTGLPSAGHFLWGTTGGGVRAANANGLVWDVVPEGGPGSPGTFGNYSVRRAVGTGQTVDDGTDVLAEHALSVGERVQVEARIIGRSTTGDLASSFVVVGTFQRVSGGSSQIGTTTAVEHESDGRSEASLDLDDDTIEVVVTGVPGRTFDWIAEVTWRIFKN